MTKILPVADKIFGGEKAISLYEMHLQSPGSRGFHRYQIIHVPRNGIVCEWRKDMGLADNFKGISQLRIPSFMEHTVNELMDIADNLRWARGLDIKGLLQLDAYNPG